MSLDTFILQLLAGLSSAGIYFLMASGLALIFGALRIVNFAQGSFYMLGAFLAISFGSFLGDRTILSFGIALLLTALVVGLLGAGIEISILRRVYDKPVLTQLTVTFALVYIIAGLIRVVFGSEQRTFAAPSELSGSIGLPIGDLRIPAYQVFIFTMAVATFGLLMFMLHRTSFGRLIRAAVDDPVLLALAGRNPRRLFTGVFALGTALAGLAGAAVAPIGAVGLGIDVSTVILAFIIIVIGGLGSVGGAFVASLLVGIVESFGVLLWPQGSLSIVFVVLVVVLALRPEGLFGKSAL